jgi:hypothetical protein
LEDLKGAMSSYVALRQHDVVKREERKNDPSERWVYRAYVDGAPDQGWALIAGDVLYNLRCALDHVAVALNPRKNKSKVYFPIISQDPWAYEAGTRRYVQRDPTTRRNFARWTRDMDPTAAAYIKSVQPYHDPTRADEHVAFTLGRFHNADKHRQELVQISGMFPDHVILTHPGGERTRVARDRLPEDGGLKNGAVIITLPAEVDVEIFGSALVAIGSSADGGFKVPQILDGILSWVDTVLSALDTLVRT